MREKGRQAGFGGMSKSMPSFSVKGRGRVSGKGLYGTVFLYGYKGRGPFFRFLGRLECGWVSLADKRLAFRGGQIFFGLFLSS